MEDGTTEPSVYEKVRQRESNFKLPEISQIQWEQSQFSPAAAVQNFGVIGNGSKVITSPQAPSPENFTVKMLGKS